MTNAGIPEVAKREDETASKPSSYFADVVRQRLERRAFIKAAGVFGAGLVLTPVTADAKARVRPRANGSRLQFQPIALSSLDAVVVPVNYSSNVVIRWGDPLFPTAPDFNPMQQTGFSQSQQFGFNCDFIAQFPVPPSFDRQAIFNGGLSPLSLRLLGLLFPTYLKRSYPTYLLWVNHEYTTGSEMFVGYTSSNPTLDQVETEIQGHGGSVVAVRRQPNGSWLYDQSSPFNRRITGTTPIRIAGPLAGHPYLRTSEDPDGYTVQGMFNNCGGGVTPWGTVLSCEENFDQYFANAAGVPEPLKTLYARMPAPSGASFRKWERYDTRFDLTEEPNEYARFGFVVEIDPYNPDSMPAKHTALGRIKHEGAGMVLTSGNRVVVYSGDDARFEYVYKFVSSGVFNRADREGAKTLLDEGTLYVARFNADGSGEWLPLVAGEGPLAGAAAFPTQAEVLINTRGAADFAGATKMDRPEDIDVSPVTKKVYCAFTNNNQRADANLDAANPRPNNTWGHIIEIAEDGDNDSLTFRWEILILCGNPAVQGEFPADPRGVYFGGFDVTQVSPLGAPDNLDFDSDGNLWIATDGQPSIFQKNDGIYAVPVEGADRGFLRQFLSGVPGAEVASLKISGDQKTLFATIQHPGEDRGLPNPISNWPDGDMPKPSVVAVRHLRGKVIGSR